MPTGSHLDTSNKSANLDIEKNGLFLDVSPETLGTKASKAPEQPAQRPSNGADVPGDGSYLRKLVPFIIYLNIGISASLLLRLNFLPYMKTTNGDTVARLHFPNADTSDVPPPSIAITVYAICLYAFGVAGGLHCIRSPKSATLAVLSWTLIVVFGCQFTRGLGLEVMLFILPWTALAVLTMAGLASGFTGRQRLVRRVDEGA